MSRRRISIFSKTALSVSAFLLFCVPIFAGDRVHSAQQRPQVAVSAPTARPASNSGTVTVTVKTADATQAPKMVTLRGPDGKIQQFPLEGEVVVLTSPVVLRSGKTLTIYWMAAK
jgi:hypothetical protein